MYVIQATKDIQYVAKKGEFLTFDKGGGWYFVNALWNAARFDDIEEAKEWAHDTEGEVVRDPMDKEIP